MKELINIYVINTSEKYLIILENITATIKTKEDIMRIFNLDNQYSIVCNSLDTRNGFKHIATLCKNGYEIGKTKICYLNRTWERFRYESILIKIAGIYFDDKEKEKYLEVISKMR